MKTFVFAALLMIVSSAFAYVDERDAAEFDQLTEMLDTSEKAPLVDLCGQTGYTKVNCTYLKPGTNQYFALVTWPSGKEYPQGLFNQSPECIEGFCVPGPVPMCTYMPKARGSSTKDYSAGSNKMYVYCSTTTGRWLHTKF